MRVGSGKNQFSGNMKFHSSVLCLAVSLVTVPSALAAPPSASNDVASEVTSTAAEAAVTSPDSLPVTELRSMVPVVVDAKPAAVRLAESVEVVDVGAARSLARTVRSALMRSPSVVRSTAELQAAKSRLDQAYSGLRPVYRARAGYGLDDFRNVSRPEGAREKQQQWSASISQTLFDGFAGRNRVRQGRAELAGAEAVLSDSKEAVAQLAALTHLEILRDRQLLPVMAESLSRHRQYLDRIDRLVKAKAARSTDRELAYGREIQVSQQLVSQRGKLAEAEALYELHVGLQAGELALPDLRQWVVYPDAKSAIAAARSQNATLQALQLKVDALESSLKVAQAALYPSVSVEATYSNREDLDGVNYGFRDERSARVLLLVDYSFRSGLERGRIEEIRANLDAARARVAEEQEKIDAEITSAWLALDEDRRLQPLLKEREERAVATRIGFEAQFQAGLKSTLDLLSAAADESDAKFSRLSGEFQILASELELVSRIGGLSQAVLARSDSVGEVMP